ncbi:MAG: AmmeMemoRadiSam system protein B [Candidatus Caldarchaeum sp.]|nr:AmmeMemoRadiSam system protein B [Candidatus Caldarchaeum sp.]MCS7133898.1 AmmeMemoRadiSam system protein B [Candidatus Caldarchaeum sp.]MCX8201534.1 AmmeMemoRadiSam system protein B [Candidatus Caldarchaeum sp.]MDW8062806.1 AmmeMemoRadiSam system protein B [Candidatus Caldarchaeum sp.]MDW8435181.1 AmmeMemoRadiSam system protein B [Candidatus Caldarchaeum sp.]
MQRRKPAVAGLFYEGSKKELLKQVEGCFLAPTGPGQLPRRRWGEKRVPALICPHAGLMYSGPVAAYAYLQLDNYSFPESVVVLGPNHYGIGTIVSIYPGGFWSTPLGDVKIDEKLAGEIAQKREFFFLDEGSHSREHSIEVQLPFLQYVYGDFLFVPICINDQSLETCVEIGEAVAEVVKGRNILLVASTDFTHYEPHDKVIAKDRLALQRIAELDVEGMYRMLEKHGITMCGYGAVAAVLTAAKKLGAEKAVVLKQSTSGETGGDYESVVGYASCLIEIEKT